VRVRPREKIWVVRPGDGRTVAEIVRRAGETAAVIQEGRVFVGKKRVTIADQLVRPGDTVRIGPAQPPRPHLAAPEVEILFQEAGLAACVKPAGLPTVPDHAGAAHSLVALVAKALGKKTDELRVTSRLDRDVSGVVIFALDAAAEDRLKRARAEGRYQRRYIALAAVTGERGLAEEGIWNDPIGRGADPRLRVVRGRDAKEASTHWRRVATALPASPSNTGTAQLDVALLAVDPVTGRTHQIRVHASHAGAPLVGDRDYGGPTRLVLPDGRILSPTRIALHAARVIVPGARELVEARAPIPAELTQTWAALGGEANAWDRAISVESPI
jgi:23S rRNA-/tRNA-specific pseudouridylate synthase